jgi:oxygen-independent coproporphyrinogen-3 oxidase
VDFDDTLGLYVSIPFCASKCSYCNFASGVFARDRMVPYVQRVVQELHEARSRATAMGAKLPREIGSIYFGGGTPSLLPPDLFWLIADAVRDEFAVASSAEWTIECAPGQLYAETLEAMVQAGVNRISFGVQSFVDAETKAVGRLHSAMQTQESIAQVRAAGITNINVDLLAGLPHQTHASWQQSLDAALALGVPHVSVYMLEVDEDSRLGRELIVLGDKYHARSVPTDDAIADFYEMACAQLAAARIAQYEISNFARPGLESRHNLRYWRRQPYLGVGLDAHSCLHSLGDSYRLANPETMDAYLAGQAGDVQVMDAARRAEEAWFLGLRQNAGVDARAIRREFGEACSAQQEAAHQLAQDGLLERDGEVYRLSPRGRMISNDVFEKFVGDRELAWA